MHFKPDMINRIIFCGRTNCEGPYLAAIQLIVTSSLRSPNVTFLFSPQNPKPSFRDAF